MAEQLLSTLKGVKPVTKTPLPRDAFIDPVTGAERPMNNSITNPTNYQADVKTGQKNAVINKQISAIAENPNLAPEVKQTQMKTLSAQKATPIGIAPEMRTQIVAEQNLPQNQYVTRDLDKESLMVKKLGGQPTSSKEFSQMMVAAYGKAGLEEMGATVGAGGAITVFDPAKLKEAGFSDEQIAGLQESGQMANKAQVELNATPKPTNSMLGIFQNALKAASGVGNQQIGKSNLMNQAGISTTGALGYGALAQAMQQRRAEMGQKYDSYSNLLQTVGGQMNDTYSNALEAYKMTADRYDKQVTSVEKINSEARDYERQLDLLNRKSEIDREDFAFQEELKAKYEAAKEDIEWQPETENQAAGFINKKTGEFTPLTVGGDAYGDSAVKGSGYLGDGVYSNGGALTFEQPVPHGAANTTVVESNPNLIDIYKNGFQKAAGANGYGGQCAFESEQWVDFNGKGWTVGNTIQQKAASLANFVKQGQAFYKGQGDPKVGYAVISNDDPQYGHVWVINAKTPDGKLVASEFNRAGTRTYSNNRVVDPNDKSIIGFLKTTPKPKYQVEKENTAAANIKKAAQGVKNIAQGKVQGGLLDLLQASAGVAKDYLVDSGNKLNNAKVKKEMEAKVQEGIKAGILDDTGKPFSPDRTGVRSGLWSDTMLNQKYSELKKAVQKGQEPQAALDAFQSDYMYGKQKAQELASQQKLNDKFSQPMNEGQSKAIGFAVSAKQAEGFMPMGGDDPNLGKLNDWLNRSGSENDIISDKLNEIKDPVGRAIAQAEMQWIQNVLRGESGAAISLGEYKTKGAAFFPRPGDSAELIKNKKLARQVQVNNLIVQGGPQGAQYWQNSGYDLPAAIAKQYGMSNPPKTDSLGVFGEGGDSLGLGL